jgi:hypothetical protein
MLGIVGSKKYRKYFALRPDYVTADEQAGSNPKVWLADKIGIGAAVTRRPLPHHRAYGSVHGGSSWLR